MWTPPVEKHSNTSLIFDQYMYNHKYMWTSMYMNIPWKILFPNIFKCYWNILWCSRHMYRCHFLSYNCNKNFISVNLVLKQIWEFCYLLLQTKSTEIFGGKWTTIIFLLNNFVLFLKYSCFPRAMIVMIRQIYLILYLIKQ